MGGSIGLGLWVGSGAALAHGGVKIWREDVIILGPAGLVIAFILTTCIVWLMMQSVGELATSYPVPSAFSTWSSQFVDRALGFATG